MAYEFNVDDFRQFSEDIIKAEGDQATLTTILADMQGTFTDAVALAVKNSEDLSRINEENNRLKDANRELFLRVGTKVAEEAGVITKSEDPPLKTAEFMSSYFKKLEEK